MAAVRLTKSLLLQNDKTQLLNTIEAMTAFMERRAANFRQFD